MDVSPLCIILVKNGSGGDKLLFKYPFSSDENKETKTKYAKRNPYACTLNDELRRRPVQHVSFVTKDGKLRGFSDKDTSHLFGVKSELCGSKFELKVNDVRFVGHPMLLHQPQATKRQNEKHKSSIILFNIVFALKATLSHDIVDCYHDLSHRLGIALRHEDQRSHFLSKETKIMLAAHDEAPMTSHAADDKTSPYQLILERNVLAKQLRDVYEDLCTTGIVQLRLNNWTEVSFCLPQKVHHSLQTGRPLNCESLLASLHALKPYHTMLLLVNRCDLLRSLAADASPALRRLLHIESPLKPFYTLAADADLTLLQVFMLVGHLVYWGKAMVIYPLCSTSVYVLSPQATTVLNSKIAESYSEDFPGCSLHEALYDFSLPTSLSDQHNFISTPQQQQQVPKVLWLLKHGLLQQLHIYVYLMPQDKPTDGMPSRITSSQGILNHISTSTSQSPQHIGGMGQPAEAGSSPSTNSISHTLHSTSVATSSESSTLHLDSGIHLSHPPSESDLGSVCSDERSPSPVVGVAAVAEESVKQMLDEHLSPSEKEMVMKVPASHNAEDLKLFARICPYLRGQHHLEEIMYRANLWRSELLQILDKFHEVLITCQLPDNTLTPACLASSI
ncbi:GATOR complex protein Nprl3 isoform X2 [Oratosquilla oratoria]|uniref:GATOR complex protein Nprl3 isoform X2 n=1 Tax=Oratosquilla oratoria TaxID=337810 RepID=UPI003F76DC4A